MKTSTIAIIGGGNMGSSLVGGLIGNQHPADKLIITDQDQEKLLKIQDQFLVNTTTNNRDAVREADVVIFAIKPQVFADVALEVKEFI